MQNQKSFGTLSSTGSLSSLAGFIADQSALGRWKQDLARVAAQGFEPFEWAMAGQGVIVEHRDADDAIRLIHLMANEIGFAVADTTSTDVGVEAIIDGSVVVTKPTLGLIVTESTIDSDAPSGQEDSGLATNAPASGLLRGAQVELATFFDTRAKIQPVVLVTVVRSIHDIPEALRAGGRFDRRLSLPEFSDEVLGHVFLREVGECFTASMLSDCSAKIGSIIRITHPDSRRRSILVQALRRRAWRENREVTLQDVLQLTSLGTGDDDPSLSNASARWPTAVHEAGHALVSWLDSRERRAPAFVAATGVRAAIGVMVPAHDAVEQTTRDDTRRDLDHTIRVALAGRAAEVMLLGEQSISAAGAERDLRRVSELATMMFSRWGLSPGIDGHDDPSSNLLVISEDADDVEKARVAGLVRNYLRKQYREAYAILEQNHALLGRIADALAAHGVLFQEDFERLSV